MSTAMSMVVVLVVGVLVAGGVAQSPTPSCAAQLVPCRDYMNGTTTPPDSCCQPLKETVKNDLPCLCALYASPLIFKVFNVSITDALRLSNRCGIDSSTNNCSSLSPTAAPPGGKSAGYRTTSVFLPGFMSVFVILFSVWA